MKNKSFINNILSIILWLLIWHIAAMVIDNSIFLPTPLEVIEAIDGIIYGNENFVMSICSSILHIGLGFVIGAILGIILAYLSSLDDFLNKFIGLPIKVLKTVPVASFIILTMLWVESKNLSTVIAAFVVLPIMYINTNAGIKYVNEKLIYVAQVFKIAKKKRITGIYILSGCSISVGMAFKAGVAAEVIGIVNNTIGNEIYKAKLYLMIPELFAWTIILLIVSVLCEKIVKLLIKQIER